MSNKNLDSAILYTSNIKKITDFYQQVVGLKLEYTDGDHYVSFIFPSGARLGINRSEFDRETPGAQTVFIATDNIKEEYQHFKNLNYEFFEEYEEYDWGTYFAILDPDGNKLAFIARNRVFDTGNTIILTSAGIKIPNIGKEFIKLLPRPAKDTKIAHIITASNVAPNTEYVKRDREAMKNLGFRVKDITLEGKDQGELGILLREYDIIYVQGGNGFYLLRHIHESGFDKVVKKLIKQGKWYVGVSAGSYVACPTIEMHKWKREVDQNFGVTDMSAMNLVPFLLTVHYDREKYREKLAENIPTATYPVRILTDEQMLVIRNNKITFAGKGSEVDPSNIV